MCKVVAISSAFLPLAGKIYISTQEMPEFNNFLANFVKKAFSLPRRLRSMPLISYLQVAHQFLPNRQRLALKQRIERMIMLNLPRVAYPLI